jgi:hypothetical protein
MKSFLAVGLCLLSLRAGAAADERVRRLYRCRGVAQWEGADHEILLDVFAPVPGEKYQAFFHQVDGTYSTYAGKLTAYLRFQDRGAARVSSTRRVWLSIPAPQASAAALEFTYDPPKLAAAENPTKVDISIDAAKLSGTILYKFWVGARPLGAPALQFQADLACAKKDAKIDVSKIAGPKALDPELK